MSRKGPRGSVRAQAVRVGTKQWLFDIFHTSVRWFGDLFGVFLFPWRCALVCILQCCLLPLEFCDFVPVHPTDLLLCSSFLCNKESFLQPGGVVILFLQLSSQVCCFCVSLSFFSPLYFCWWMCGVFLDVFFSIGDAGWTKGVLILVQCVFVFGLDEDEQTFSSLQVHLI